MWPIAQPWEIARDPAELPELQAVCAGAINLFRLLTLLLEAGACRSSWRARREVLRISRPLQWADAALLPTGTGSTPTSIC